MGCHGSKAQYSARPGEAPATANRSIKQAAKLSDIPTSIATYVRLRCRRDVLLHDHGPSLGWSLGESAAAAVVGCRTGRIYTVLEDDVCAVVPAMGADAMPTAGICAVHALDGWCCVTTRDRELRIYAIQAPEEPGKPPALQLAHCVSAAHELTPSAVALSPQAGRVASGARDASVALFDISTGAEQCRGSDARALVTALAWASHSELVVAAEDLALRVWDCRSNTTFQVSGKSDSVQYFPKRVAVSHSGRYIASGARGVHAADSGSAAAQGGEVRIWDLRMPGKMLASVAASGAVGSDCVALAWSENDQQVRSLYASGYLVDCLLSPDYQGMTTSIKRSISDHLQAPLHCAAAWPAAGPSPPQFVYAADDIATYSCLATTR